MAHGSSDVPTGAVAVSLLGRFALHVDGRDEVRLPHRAQQLLAYLLVHREQGHSRDRLADALWAADRREAEGYLREALADLDGPLGRRVVAGGAAELDDGWISLDAGADLHVDLWAFVEGAQEHVAAGRAALDAAALASAVAVERLYQGHLLETWTEPWCREPRERVRRRYVGLLDAILASCEAAEDFTKVVLYATRSLAADPTRESAHRSLILALHRLGDRSGALRQVQRCTDALRAAAGREPEPETMALIELLRAASPPDTRTDAERAG